MLLSDFFTVIFLFPFLGLCESTDPPFTHEVSLHISQGEEALGTIELGLFGTVVPKSVENFVTLATGYKGISYNNTIFHRIIKGFVVQGGDFENSDGTGGYSIYDGKKFDDENFDIKFTQPGYIAYANSGPDTNGAQFFITTTVTPYLDGKHVIFGKVTNGTDVLSEVENVKTGKDNKPQVDVILTSVGVVKLQVDQNDEKKWEDEQNSEVADSSGKNHKGWLVFVVLIFVGIVLYGIRLRTLQHREIREEIEFHRV